MSEDKISIFKVARVQACKALEAIGQHVRTYRHTIDGLEGVENYILNQLRSGAETELEMAVRNAARRYPNVIGQYFNGSYNSFCNHFVSRLSGWKTTIMLNGRKVDLKGISIFEVARARQNGGI